MLDAGKSLCSLLKMVFVAFLLEAANTPQHVKMLYQKVKDLIQKQFASVIAPQTLGEDNSALFRLIFQKFEHCGPLILLMQSDSSTAVESGICAFERLLDDE